jgi:hypothetical protein
MAKITKKIVARFNDTHPFDIVFKYNQDSIPIDVTGDVFKLRIYNNQKSFEFNSTDNPTNLFVENTNELHWNLNSTNGYVEIDAGVYEFAIKRVLTDGRYTELTGDLLIEKRLV